MINAPAHMSAEFDRAWAVYIVAEGLTFHFSFPTIEIADEAADNFEAAGLGWIIFGSIARDVKEDS